jgi:hypothetical protein
MGIHRRRQRRSKMRRLSICAVDPSSRKIVLTLELKYQNAKRLRYWTLVQYGECWEFSGVFAIENLTSNEFSWQHISRWSCLS